MPPYLGLEMDNKKSKKKPFKLTRELIKLALRDGWTQKEIADTCRTQQSVVSQWKKGAKKGSEQQLLPLLDLYGHKLRRNAFKVYWSIDSKTSARTFYRVEGKVVLSKAFYDAVRDTTGKLSRKTPKLKLVVHHQGDGKFRVVYQSRLSFQHSNYILENSVEDAVWHSIITDRLDLEKLIEVIDDYAKSKLKDYPSDANTLPFLIRQSLLNHGFQIEDIVNFPASW